MADTLANTHGRVREWIGPRIIPVFADEVQWNVETNYEPLMMVQNAGETFMSRQYVPAGAPLPDTSNGQESTEYWVHMSNWNAQVEGYREEVMEYAQEVLAFDGRIDTLENSLPTTAFDDENTIEAAFNVINAMLPSTSFDSENTVKSYIDSEVSSLQTYVNKEIEDINDEIEYTFRRGEKLVIFSDSTFQTNPDPATGTNVKSIATYISELCGITVDNRGVGGQSISALLQQLNNTGATDIIDADYVIVAEGINDWQGGTKLINLGTGSGDYGNDFESLYTQCIDKIKQLAPKATIICVAPAYIHSPANAVLNLNNIANDFHAYCDIIQHVANIENCACVRLDRIMGINESNYTSQLIQSAATGIWVHHNAKTNYKIAKMLITNINGVSGCSSEQAINVSNKAWLRDAEVRNWYRVKQAAIIKNTTDVTLVATDLEPDCWYALSFVAACDVKKDGILFARSLNAQMSIIPFKATATSHTFLFTNSISGELINPCIWRGRPSYYDAFNVKIWGSKLSGDTANGKFTYNHYAVGNLHFVHIKLKSGNTITANSTTAIDYLPAGIRLQYYGTGVVNQTGGITGASIRVNPGDGGIYSNTALNNATLIEAMLFGLE